MKAFKIIEITKYAAEYIVEGFDSEEEACEYFRDNYEEITSSTVLNNAVDCYIYDCYEIVSKSSGEEP